MRAPLRVVGTVGLALVLLHCGDDATGGGVSRCVDLDGDGFGAGCELGDDCDDRNAARIRNCDLNPPPDCTVNPVLAGCACFSGAASTCYEGDAANAGVGLCRRGIARCTSGFYGLCTGQVLPGIELCDDLDNDCDDRVDENVESPCGRCTPNCVGGVWGGTDLPFAEEQGEGIALTNEGALTLPRVRSFSSFVWVANSGEGTLSKVDGAVGLERGRYDTGGFEPSRVAVDYLDDAFVANREFGGVSTLTKVAGTLERCVDRSGDGVIQTSVGPDLVPGDECILWTIPVGDVDGVARALAVDGSRGVDRETGGNIWVGLHDEEAVLEVDGDDGTILDRIDLPGFQPYAAAFDPRGTLWMISRDGFLVSIDRFENPRVPVTREVPLACFLLYGLAVEDDGRVVMTGHSCDTVTVFDVLDESWSTVQTPPSTRGAVVREADGEEEVWVAHTDGRVSLLRLSPQLSLVGTYTLASGTTTPIEAIGIGVDAAGNVWAASSLGGGENQGVVTRIDGTTFSPTAQVPVGFSPHTQGDLTGGKLLAGFAPEGRANQIFDGCGSDETRWDRLHVDALTSAGSLVQVSMRHAATRDALAQATFELVATLPTTEGPWTLSFPEGGVVEVEVVLQALARDGAPIIDRIGVEWSCGGPII